jgi:hypothetical protein
MDVSVINVTPKRAAELLDLTWEKQRRVDRIHVNFLASEMKRGRFDPSTIELVSIAGNGKTVLIDGQHALHGIVEAGRNQQMILVERIVQNESDIAYHFSRIDVQRKRGLKDSLNAFDMNDKVPLARWQIVKLAAAIRFIDNRFGLSKNRIETAIEDNINSIIEWSPYMMECISIYESSPGQQLEKGRFLNQPVLSIGLVLFRYINNKERVRSFWNGFMHGTNLKNGDPRLISRNKYLSISTFGGLSGPTTSQWRPHQIARLVAWGWNTYYVNETRSRVTLRNLDTPMPIELKGTKYYTGRQV